MKNIIYCCATFFTLALSPLQKEPGKWTILKTSNNIPGRSECGFAACNGMLYLVGGDAEPAAVEMLDPITNTWHAKTMSPVAMHHFQAVTCNNKIYVLDAFSRGGYPRQANMSNVYCYDPVKDQWEKKTEIPVSRRRAAAGAAVYDGKLYLAAGITNGHTSGTNNMFDVYDPATNKWDSLPSAPHKRDHCMAAVVKDKLYLAGGRNTSYHEPNNFMSFFDKTVLETDCYDFKTGKWTTLEARLPLGSGGGSLVNLHDKLYYIGGERATGKEPNAPRKNTFRYDPSSNEGWVAVADLNEARNGCAAAVLNDKIYLAGGSGGGPGGPPPIGQAPGNPPGKLNPQDTSHPRPPNGVPGPANSGGKIVVEVFEVK